MNSLFNRAVRTLVVLALVYLLIPVQLPTHAEDSANLSDSAATNETQNLKEDQVQFKNGDVVLAGTLLTPLTSGVHPAVVILHGSGPNKGSGYRVYAEQFVRAGIATLLYDKRGSGKSTGNWRYRTLDDLTGDALAAVAYLKSRPEINPQQIGLGHQPRLVDCPSGCFALKRCGVRHYCCGRRSISDPTRDVSQR